MPGIGLIVLIGLGSAAVVGVIGGLVLKVSGRTRAHAVPAGFNTSYERHRTAGLK